MLVDLARVKACVRGKEHCEIDVSVFQTDKYHFPGFGSRCAHVGLASPHHITYRQASNDVLSNVGLVNKGFVIGLLRNGGCVTCDSNHADITDAPWRLGLKAVMIYIYCSSALSRRHNSGQ